MQLSIIIRSLIVTSFIQTFTNSGSPPTSPLVFTTGLVPATSYSFVLSCSNAYGTSSNSTSILGTTSAAAPSLVTITNTSTSTTSSTSTSSTIYLSWNAANGGMSITSCTATAILVSGYAVTYYSQSVGTTLNQTFISPSTASPLSFSTGLKAASTYSFVLACSNSVGSSTNSSSIAGTTAATAPFQTQITSTTAPPATSSTVDLTYAAASGGSPITSCTAIAIVSSGYGVTYYNQVVGMTSLSQTFTNSGSPPTSPLVFTTGLVPATSYSFVLSCSNAYGTSSNSTSILGTTSAAAPSLVTIASTTSPISSSSTVYLSWSAANGGSPITSCVAIATLVSGYAITYYSQTVGTVSSQPFASPSSPLSFSTGFASCIHLFICAGLQYCLWFQYQLQFYVRHYRSHCAISDADHLDDYTFSYRINSRSNLCRSIRWFRYYYVYCHCDSAIRYCCQLLWTDLWNNLTHTNIHWCTCILSITIQYCIVSCFHLSVPSRLYKLSWHRCCVSSCVRHYS